MYQGCKDNQTEGQKAKNYKLEEICASILTPEWEEKTVWASYPVRNQDGSSQCVCMTLATEMGIIFEQKYNEWIDFSSSFPYQQRGGTYGGCTSADIYSVFPKLGNVFENTMLSQNMNETQCQTVEMKSWYKDIAKPFIVKRIQLPIDFETVASTIFATGKGVMVWFSFASSEWTPIPEVSTQPANSNHSVTAIDFLLKGGKKYLVIQDSYGLGTGTNGCRLISEEFFKAKCFLASYLKTFEIINPDLMERPKFDGSIMSAQTCFKYEGLFPSNIAEVEAWGPITTGACIAFQKRYNITPALGVFGPITQAKLLEIYK